MAGSPRLAAQTQRQGTLFGNSATGTGAVQRRPNRTGLPDRLKAGIERLSGLSMDHIRVRRNSSKPASLDALAYTQGSEIHVAPGQERHLPHEAWHAAQQQQGRVRPTFRKDGVPVNDSRGLEHEADVMGRRALQTPPSAHSDSTPPR